MAQGTSRAPDIISEDQGETRKDYAGHAINVALCQDTFAASAAFVSYSQFNPCASVGGYSGPVTTPSTWTRAGAATSLGLDAVSFAQNASGPDTIRTAVIYDADASLSGVEDVITVVDLTTDGSTPVSLIAGALNINLDASAVLISTRV